MAAVVAWSSVLALRNESERAPPLTSLESPARTHEPKASQRKSDDWPPATSFIAEDRYGPGEGEGVGAGAAAVSGAGGQPPPSAL
jgi:hypothetical protein